MGEQGSEAEETLSAVRKGKEMLASTVPQALKRKLQRAVLRATADVALLAMWNHEPGQPWVGRHWRARVRNRVRESEKERERKKRKEKEKERKGRKRGDQGNDASNKSDSGDHDNDASDESECPQEARLCALTE